MWRTPYRAILTPADDCLHQQLSRYYLSLYYLLIYYVSLYYLSPFHLALFM